MSEAPATVLASSSKQLALRLLRRRSFGAGYLTQVIDLAIREVLPSQFDEPDEREAALVHQRLTRYAANGQPGSTELARAMLAVRHALDLVRHGHYRASAVPERTRHGRLRGTAARTGHRSRPGPSARGAGGALVVIAENEEASTVYRPVSATQTHALRRAARSAKEEAIRLHEGAVEVLRPHVRMADWSKDDGYGVAVDVVRHGVSVQWWPAAVPESQALWEQGGIRALCVALLTARFAVSCGDEGTPHAIVLRI